jgi:flagellin-like protein
MKKRRAISPIIGVIILIGIAIIGGALLSSAQSQFLNTAFTQIEYRVTEMRLEKDSGGSCFFFARIHNSGTEPITATKINATTNSGLQWFPTNPALSNQIAPTQNLDVFEAFSGNSCGNFTIGNTYSIGIEATSPTSSFKMIQPVQIRDVTN